MAEEDGAEARRGRYSRQCQAFCLGKAGNFRQEAVMNKKKKKMIDYGRYGYFFIAPFFITYLVFQLWPLINNFYYSTLSYYKRNGREFMEFA